LNIAYKINVIKNILNPEYISFFADLSERGKNGNKEKNL